MDQHDKAYSVKNVAQRRDTTLRQDSYQQISCYIHARMSRAFVREAIRQLEANGHVEHIRRLGNMIHKLDYAEISEIYDTCSLFEGADACLGSELKLGEFEELHVAMRDVHADPVRSRRTSAQASGNHAEGHGSA